jgi:hypothetical protein
MPKGQGHRMNQHRRMKERREAGRSWKGGRGEGGREGGREGG